VREISLLSRSYGAKRMTPGDAQRILELYEGNPLYYEHLGEPRLSALRVAGFL
jgi:hypothetical protein